MEGKIVGTEVISSVKQSDEFYLEAPRNKDEEAQT